MEPGRLPLPGGFGGELEDGLSDAAGIPRAGGVEEGALGGVERGGGCRVGDGPQGARLALRRARQERPRVDAQGVRDGFKMVPLPLGAAVQKPRNRHFVEADAAGELSAGHVE